MPFLDFIRKVKALVKSEYRLIEAGSERINEYGVKETYKEKFYDIARNFQKKYGLSQKEGIEYASTILKERDKLIKEAKDKGKALSNYEALQEISDDILLDYSDVDIVNYGTP